MNVKKSFSYLLLKNRIEFKRTTECATKLNVAYQFTIFWYEFELS